MRSKLLDPPAPPIEKESPVEILKQSGLVEAFFFVVVLILAVPAILGTYAVIAIKRICRIEVDP